MSGRATYLYLGNGQAVGQVAKSFVGAGDDGELLGDDANLVTFNHGASGWATIDGSSNSNSFAAHTDGFGPDVTLVRGLAEMNPEGIMMFKAAKDGSALTYESAPGGTWAKADADLYTDALTAWQTALDEAITTVGVVPDLRAAILQFGESDVPDSASVASFEADLRQLIADVREDFKTRTDAAALPIFLVGMRYNATDFDGDDVATIQAAMRTLSQDDPRVFLLSTDDLRVRSDAADTVHFSGEALLDCGDRLADLIKAQLTALAA